MSAQPSSLPLLGAGLAGNRFAGWRQLAALQFMVSVVLFHDYVFGEKFFAYVDIGSDTFAQFVPALMHLANPSNWASPWSFNVGLGNLLALPVSPFTLLGIAGGPDHVLDMRIWVYLVKIFGGGAAFYGFLAASGARREIAVLAALSYSFCGYVTTDGQWDPSSTEFVAYAVLLWAIASYLRNGAIWFIPLAVAFAAYTGTFIFSVGIFVLYLFAAALVVSDRPLETLATWTRSVFPQCLAGLLLAAPAVIPLVFHLLDSPRISGPQAGFGNRMQEIFSTNDRSTILIQLAAFFHKNILGVGNQHAGWMNYLESPTFYVGMLPLLLIPQLWRGSSTDRKILVAGGVALALFILLPAFRYFAFGFGLDYFRINNLWVSILLLVLFARALECVSQHGIHRRMLLGTAGGLVAALLLLSATLSPYFSNLHALAITGCLGVALALGLWHAEPAQWRRFVTLCLCLVAFESALINYASFHGPRKAVTRETPGYNDGTPAALNYLRTLDSGFYRVEKTYDSVSFCDALAQQYAGVKSYWFQVKGTVGFYSELQLLPRQSEIKNFTNWLPNFGNRFALNSLMGVKYMVSRSPLEWPGYRKIHEMAGLLIYKNELALPLGVVYERQYPRDQLVKVSAEAKDIVLMNAVVVDSVRGSSPNVFDARKLTEKSADWLADNYMTPAKTLQRRGLVIEDFSPGKIKGRIASDVPGVLVFSIPFVKGWTIEVDGVEKKAFSANLGFLATDIASGEHRVELRYTVPGMVPGLVMALLCLVGLSLVSRVRHTRAPAFDNRPGS